MNARLGLFVAGIAALSCTAVLAQPHVRPGLWDESISIKTDDPQANAGMAQMKERLASMPPDQRAAVEKMMASHGMGMSPDGKPSSIRVCITQAQIDRGFQPMGNEHCGRANVTTSGNVTKFEFSCKSQHGDITGHGTFTAMGDSAFAVSTAADSVTPKKSTHVQTDIAGKFVAADCGDIKPIEMPAAK
jgi:hypothetical protein